MLKLPDNKKIRIPTALLLIAAMLVVFVGNYLIHTRNVRATEPVSVVSSAPNALQLAWDKTNDIIDRTLQGAQKISSGIIAIVEKTEAVLDKLEGAARTALFIFLQILLANITNRIIQWILNEGGKPRFVDDWDKLLIDSADAAAGVFLQGAGLAGLCEPFRLNIKNLIRTPPEFATQVECSLSDMTGNITGFFDNFQNGGWNSWSRVIEVHNNPYGAFVISQAELYDREKRAADAAEKDALVGRGFVSQSVCRKIVATKEAAELDENVNIGDEQTSISGFETIPNGWRCAARSINTPSAVVENLLEESVTGPLKGLRESIANLLPDSGLGNLLRPFILAINDAIIVRIIREGLTAVTRGDATESRSDSDFSELSEIQRDNIIQSAEDRAEAGATAETAEQLRNMMNLVIPRRENVLGIMEDIDTVKRDILSTLSSLDDPSCALPGAERTGPDSLRALEPEAELSVGTVEDGIIIPDTESRTRDLEEQIQDNGALSREADEAAQQVREFANFIKDNPDLIEGVEDREVQDNNTLAAAAELRDLAITSLEDVADEILNENTEDIINIEGIEDRKDIEDIKDTESFARYRNLMSSRADAAIQNVTALRENIAGDMEDELEEIRDTKDNVDQAANSGSCLSQIQ